MKKIIAIILLVASLPLFGLAIERQIAVQKSQGSIDRFLKKRLDYNNNIMTPKESRERAHRTNQHKMRQTSERNMWGGFGFIALAGGVTLLVLSKKKKSGTHAPGS